jgi:endo-alpha-1,4-polygalactosaminidase (GH114 family)
MNLNRSLFEVKAPNSIWIMIVAFMALHAYPSTLWSAALSDRSARLENASTWMYQLGGLEDPSAVTSLAATEYLLLVIEPGNHHRPCRDDFDPERFGIPADRADEACADVYPTADIIAQLRTTPSSRDRLLLAYIDIGQAE